MCLETISILISPIAPFYSDLLFRDLSGKKESIHLHLFPKVNKSLINKSLEHRMELSQQISSLILSIRKKEKIKVRQPLSRVLIPSEEKEFEEAINQVKQLILSEVNVKELSFIKKNDPLLKKKARPNFKILGPKYAGKMKVLASIISSWNRNEILEFESNKSFQLTVENQPITLIEEDVEIITDDVPGWEIASNNNITVALDLIIDNNLKEEGIARDLVNKVQNVRKEIGIEVMDYIEIKIVANKDFKSAINNNLNYICSETLTENLVFVSKINDPDVVDNYNNLQFSIKKLKLS